MTVANVTTVWSSGVLVWQNSTAGEIGYWDGVNKKFVITSGANFDFSAATGSLTFATGEIVSADMNAKYGKVQGGAIAAVATSSSGALTISFQPSTAAPTLIDGFWLQRSVAVAATSGQLAVGVAVSSSDYSNNLVDTILNATGMVNGLVGTTSHVECSSTGWITFTVDNGSSGFTGRYTIRFVELTT